MVLDSNDASGEATFDVLIREAIGAIHPIGAYESTNLAVEHVLSTARGKLAATLAATLAHPTVIGYLEEYPEPIHASFDARTPSPFAGVLLPLITGPHMSRSIRFFPEGAVEPLAYARAATIARSLMSARERERYGEHAAHFGSLDWITTCARDIGHTDAFDHILVYLHDRQVHGAPDEGHNSLERIIAEREQMRARSQALYAHLLERTPPHAALPYAMSEQHPLSGSVTIQ